MAEKEIKWQFNLEGVTLAQSEIELLTKSVNEFVRVFGRLPGATQFQGLFKDLGIKTSLDEAKKIIKDLEAQKTASTTTSTLNKPGKDETKLEDWVRKLNTQIQLGKFPMLPTPEQQKKQLMTHIGLGAALAPFSSFLAARSFSNAAGGGADNGGRGGAAGIFGSGGGKFFNEFYIAIEALKKAITFVAEHIKAAFDYGAKLFIQSSKLGQNAGHLFGIRQGAEATGMSSEEMDKFLLRVGHGAGKGQSSLAQFGDMLQLGSMKSAFMEVAKDAEMAAETMHRTAGEFFTVHVQAVKTETTMKEFWALLAEGSSGVMAAFLEDMKNFFAVLNQSGTTAALGKEIGTLLAVLETVGSFVSIIFNGFLMTLNLLGTLLADFLVRVNNLVAKVPGSGLLGITKINAADVWTDFNKGAKAFTKQVDDFNNPNRSLIAKQTINDKEGKPPFAYQIPRMGQWEKLGLSFGSGGMVSDFARQTAENTRKLVDMAQKAYTNPMIPAHRSLVTNAP